MNKLFLSGAVALLISGCGGGGGSTTPTATNTAPSTPVTTQAVTCTNPHAADYPATFNGPWPTPTPTQKLDSNIVRSAAFKDYYAGMFGSLSSNCTSEEYTKLMYTLTLDRLKALNVQRAWIYNFAHWTDASHTNWTIARKNWEIPESTLVWILSEAKKRNIEIYISWQFSVQDFDGDKLWTSADENSIEVMRKIMDAHQSVMIDLADFAQANNVPGIALDWNAMYVPAMTTHKGYMTQRFAEIAGQVRQKYTGKLVYGQQVVPEYNEELYSKIDYIMIDLWNIRLTNVEAINMSVENVEAATLREFNRQFSILQKDGQVQKPVIFKFLVQSRDKFFTEGWKEDGFCISEVLANGNTHKCIQETYTTDFSVQAVGVEGILRAIKKQTQFKVESVEYNAVWLTDTLQPGKEGFPNISQSVRGKPAEKIIQYWFSK